jgi:hypothetical protein
VEAVLPVLELAPTVQIQVLVQLHLQVGVAEVEVTMVLLRVMGDLVAAVEGTPVSAVQEPLVKEIPEEVARARADPLIVIMAVAVAARRLQEQMLLIQVLPQ